MEALLTSITLVALAEIGDKTQLLSFVLAAKLRRPWAIMAGILVATLANHALAGSLGVWLASLVAPSTLTWVVGIAFIAFGLWTLRPDTLEGDPRMLGAGAFATTTVAFFLAEMGDKTQLATVALAARYDALPLVVLGTTLGMMIANVPAVIVGETLAHRLPMRTVRWVAAALFVAVGIASLIGAGRSASRPAPPGPVPGNSSQRPDQLQPRRVRRRLPGLLPRRLEVGEYLDRPLRHVVAFPERLDADLQGALERGFGFGEVPPLPQEVAEALGPELLRQAWDRLAFL